MPLASICINNLLNDSNSDNFDEANLKTPIKVVKKAKKILNTVKDQKSIWKLFAFIKVFLNKNLAKT
ncbi:HYPOTHETICAL PROTEIN MCJ_006190 [Mesomycoplasma conjunctivae]|uniref:Uncharacterized protein n=1 Tax=Mesomycoplasma conjunctivae (strain ATCC 25834 / NCTC 10147 / HRC/581) TaxID=572263 RepID=C5J751_MESCH|nr:HYPOTHETICAL PROTEIN MCJ_006190 [Mesomycoplasma conjunctivae]